MTILTGFNADFYKNGSPLVASQISIVGNKLLDPQVIVVSSDANSVIGSIAGARASKSSEFKTLYKSIEDYTKEGTLPQQPTVFSWYTNTKGTFKRLSLQNVEGDKVSLGSQKKQAIIKNLQPGGIKFAKRYFKFQQDQKVSEAIKALSISFAYPAIEDWTSKEGKVVQAKFKQLTEDNKLSLVVERFGQADKTFQLALDKLDQTSQEKARKWQKTLDEQNRKIEEARAKALKAK